MEWKAIVVLANSIKKSARCVAGRQLLAAGDAVAVGPWIRPISEIGEGELLAGHMRVGDGRPLNVLDIVQVPLLRHAADPVHPEDWIVDTETPWRRMSAMPREKVSTLIECPPDLWSKGMSRTDRISGFRVRALSTLQSIVLIRPVDLQFEIGRAYGKARRRAIFRYADASYDLALTDPVFSARFTRDVPADGAPARRFDSPYGDRCSLCVSLTPEFYEYHYKVVATVIPDRPSSP